MAKKNTAGARIAAKYAVLSAHGNAERDRLVKQIDAAVRQAAWEGWEAGMNISNLNNEGQLFAAQIAHGQFCKKYGNQPK